jgi:hypothetical protein
VIAIATVKAIEQVRQILSSYTATVNNNTGVRIFAEQIFSNKRKPSIFGNIIRIYAQRAIACENFDFFPLITRLKLLMIL